MNLKNIVNKLNNQYYMLHNSLRFYYYFLFYQIIFSLLCFSFLFSCFDFLIKYLPLRLNFYHFPYLFEYFLVYRNNQDFLRRIMFLYLFLIYYCFLYLQSDSEIIEIMILFAFEKYLRYIPMNHLIGGKFSFIR